MPTQSDDRILWLLVGLGFFVAAKVIPAHLNYVRKLTEVKNESEHSPKTADDIEGELETKTLQRLAAGRSYEIRSCAIEIVAERCVIGPTYVLLLDDLESREAGRREKAIRAFWHFIAHRSVHDSPNLYSNRVEQAFHALVTALVNILPQHEAPSTNTVSDDGSNIRYYQTDKGLPFMPKNGYATCRRQAEQMDADCAEMLKERTILRRIPTQKKLLLALTGFTPLTEHFFNKCARQWFIDEGIPVTLLSGVPEIPDVFWRSLTNYFESAEEIGKLNGWCSDVSAKDRARHVELILLALWSSGSMAVQAAALDVAIFTEANALKNSSGWRVYDAFCKERANYFRQLTGGLFEQALQSLPNGAAVTGQIDIHKSEKDSTKRNTLPPSPVRPPCRPSQERNLLLIFTKILNIKNMERALSAGLVSRWLYRYPFPCMITPSTQCDVVALLRANAWGRDDPLMAELVFLITSVPSGLEELRKYGLTKITNFQAYWHGGDWYGEPPSSRQHDIVMTGGEDTAGTLPSSSIPLRGQRPGSSWSRRGVPFDSHSEETQRRRRREAMVLSDGDGPLTASNILQRENSRAALTPGEEPGIEEQLTQLSEEIDREDEDEMAAVRARVASRRAALQRQPLADITGLGS